MRHKLQSVRGRQAAYLASMPWCRAWQAEVEPASALTRLSLIEFPRDFDAPSASSSPTNTLHTPTVGITHFTHVQHYYYYYLSWGALLRPVWFCGVVGVVWLLCSGGWSAVQDGQHSQVVLWGL